jgi:hypothetical protein
MRTSLANLAKLLGLAGVVAVIVAVVSPPTRPVASPAADWRRQIPVKTGTAPPAAVTGVVPPNALSRPPPVQPTPAPAPAEARDDDGYGASDEDAVVRRDDGAYQEVAERRYRQGYRWAKRYRIEDERYCYQAPDDPFIAGCMAGLYDNDDDRRGDWGDDDRDRRGYGWRG